LFETRIAAALTMLDPARPILVEAESSKVGDRLVPPSLWRAMRAAPMIKIEADIDARTRYLCAAYADLFADLPQFKTQLNLLVPFQGRARVAAWHAMAAEGQFDTLVRDLIERHYDPRYAKAASRTPIAQVHTRLDDAGLDETAAHLVQRLQSLTDVALETIAAP